MKLSKQNKNKISAIYCKKSNLASDSNYKKLIQKYNSITINIELETQKI